MFLAEQMLKDTNGKSIAVLIPVEKYKKMKEMMEELEDIKSFDKAMKRNFRFKPFDEAVKKIRMQRKKG